MKFRLIIAIFLATALLSSIFSSISKNTHNHPVDEIITSEDNFSDDFDDGVLSPSWTKVDYSLVEAPDTSNNEELIEQNGKLELVVNGSGPSDKFHGIQIHKDVNAETIKTIEIEFNYSVPQLMYWYIYGEDNDLGNGFYTWRIYFADVWAGTSGLFQVAYFDSTYTVRVPYESSQGTAPEQGIIRLFIQFAENYDSFLVLFQGDWNASASGFDLASWSKIGIGFDILHNQWPSGSYANIDNYYETHHSMVDTITETITLEQIVTVTTSVTYPFVTGFLLLVPIILLRIRRR